MQYDLVPRSNRIPAVIAQKLVHIVRSRSGISVNPQNQAFLELRISRRARELDLTLDAYLDLLMGPIGDRESQRLVEMLATHTTDFFREKAHYQFLETRILPDLYARGAGREWPLIVWSAACSIGSELWSAGMVLGQFAAKTLGGLRYKLQGTDISDRVIQRAQRAVYTQEEIRGIPENLRKIYLLRARNDADRVKGHPQFRIDPNLRNMAHFQNFNLVRPLAPPGFHADVAFLRNVLIYFSPADQAAALGTVISHLRPDGYLFLGHSEQLPSSIKGLTQVGPASYQRSSHAV